MKRLIFLICAVSSYMVADEDAKGFYKLTGLDVQYYMAARYDTDIDVTDIYGAGVTLTISTINAGEIFYQARNGPLSEAALNAISVNLNVLLNADGTGRLAEGSSYPDQELIEGTCVSEILILPITDDLLYESSGTLSRPNAGVNVVGIPSISTYGPYDHDNDDATANIPHMFGGLGLSQSVVFDYFPMDPVQPQLCDNGGSCFDLCYPDGTLTGGVLDGACDLYPSSSGAPMLGYQAGYWWKEGFPGHPTDIAPTIPGNTDPDFYLEWHAIDGGAAESGLGDIIGTDEDGDGTDFDRILGLPYITAAYIDYDCPVQPGLNYPIFGGQAIVDALHDLVEGGCVVQVSDAFAAGLCAGYGVEGAINQLCLGMGADAATCAYVAAEFATASGGDCDIALAMATATGDGTLCDTAADIAEGMCVTEANGTANDGYVMDASLAPWGNLLTFNAASYQQCVPGAMAQGMDYDSAVAYCGGLYGADDSDHDFNGIDGRLVMNFEPLCVQEIEIREVAAEFIDVGGELCGTGDVLCDCVCDEDATNDSDCADDDSCLDGCPSGTGLCLEDEYGAPLCSEAVNVQDIVVLVNLILEGGIPPTCGGDMNYDGNYNVIDVVQLANCVLGFSDCTSSARADNATSIEFNVIGNEVTMSADGIVGGIQMTLSHGNDFALTLTDGGQFSDHLTKGNSTILIIVNPTDNNLFTTNGDYTIESVIATNYEGSSMLNTSVSVNLPKLYSIGSAYPNPFNPTTQITLDLNTDANVSVKIFNTLGQLVDVLANTHMASGNYSLTWDGAKAASGIYFIQTEIGSEIHNQKIMLIK